MFLGRLASPAIATKCQQDSLDAQEVQVELGRRLSPVTKREKNASFKKNNTMSIRSSFNLQHEISDRVRSKFFIDGEWKTPSGSAKLDLISPNIEELTLRAPEAYPELKVSRGRRRSS
jgi:hypothetical protein